MGVTGTTKNEWRNIMRKNCIICEKEIFRSKNADIDKTRRGKNSVTCSKKCSKMYNRIYTYVSGLRQLKNHKIFIK